MRSTNKDNACLHLFKNSIRYQLDDRLQYMSQELVKHYQREQNFWGGVVGGGGGLLVFFFHMQCLQIMIQQVLI